MSPDARRSLDRSEHDNDRPPIQRTKQFRKALSSLSSKDQARVAAKLAEFEKDWAGGVNATELHAKWNYKPLKVPSGCKQAGLRQIKPTNSTRVWMAKDAQGQTLLLLWVIRKTSSQEQERIIRKLCDQLSRSEG